MSRASELSAKKRSLNVVTPPANPVVTVAELKNSLRIEASVTDDDALLSAFIEAATQTIENMTGVRMITQTLKLSLDDIPTKKMYDPLSSAMNAYEVPSRPLSEVNPSYDQIKLGVYPVKSIDSFTFFDSDNDANVWNSDNYLLDTDSKPSRLLKKLGAVWPNAIFREGSALNIQFVAGYGANATDVPQALRSAVQLLAEKLYNSRGCDSDSVGIPSSIKILISPYMVIKV